MTEQVANASQTIIEPNLIVFVDRILAAAKEGWQVDQSNPPTLLGPYYHVIMQMPEDKVPEPTLSRAEILVNARAAKKNKAAEAAAAETEPAKADGE